MKHSIKIFLILTTLSACNASGGTGNLKDGLDAFHNNRISQAEKIFTTVAANPKETESNRAEALRELGRIDWLLRGETAGLAYALKNSPAGRDGCMAAIMAQRIFREAGQPAEILPVTNEHLKSCPAAGADRLRLELASTQLAIGMSDSTARTEAFKKANELINEMGNANRQRPDVIITRFSLALAQNNATEAFTAWRDYFWLTDADVPAPMKSYSGRAQSLFEAGLAPEASRADIIAMLSMISRAGFVEQARRKAVELGIEEQVGGDPEWRRLSALFRFDDTVRALTLQANRNIAEGGKANGYEGALKEAMGQLAKDAGLSGDPVTALFDAYGIYGTIGNTGGYMSLHGGYVVQDEKIDVEQYDRTGKLRFIVVDNMFSNGFESWLWDGWAEAGGWAPDGTTVVQVRSAYINGPLSALAIARPGAEREERLTHIKKSEQSEREALAGNSIAALTAIGMRLKLQAIDKIAAKVGDDDTAFISEYWDARLQHSIYIHEGRHALDKKSYTGGRGLSSRELEYRAKLSELALADYPRMALSTISSTSTGNKSPHGHANARIMKAYRDWITNNSAAIASYDQNIPALAQLDKLSDAQIRAVAQALDPELT